jgi:hypothetical protein
MGRPMRYRIIAAALLIAGLAITAEAVAAGTNLVYAPKKGDTGKYKYVMDSAATGTDPKTGKRGKLDMMSVSAYAVLRDTVTAVSDKGATSSYKFESATVRAMGQKTDLTATLNKAGLKTTFGRSGAPTKIEGLDKLDAVSKVLAGALLTAVELPGKPVSVGATWKARQSASEGGSAAGLPNLEVSLRFAGVENRADRKVAKIVMTVDSVIDLSKMPADPQTGKKPSGKVTAKGLGTAYVDVTSGKTMELTSVVNVGLPAEATGMGTIDIKISTTLKRIGN